MIVNIKTLTLNETTYNEIINLYNNFDKIDKNILNFKNLKTLIERLPQNHNIFFYLENNI